MNLQKATTLKSPTLRNSARGEDCTLHIDGVCDYRTDTTVLAHLRELSPCGSSLKPNDLSAIYACFECHNFIDNPPAGEAPAIYWWDIARAIVRTHIRMLEKGVLKL